MCGPRDRRPTGGKRDAVLLWRRRRLGGGRQMRYLVLGAGALGGYFGGMLIKGGADVTFLVRPKRAAQLERDGLIVKLQDGSELRGKANTVQQGQLNGTYDVIL